MTWILGSPPVNQPATGATADERVTLPQFDAPFRLDDLGQPVVVQQDSAEEIGAAVYNIMTCVRGGKLNDPEFGIESPLGQNLPLDLTGIQAALRDIEPRADFSLADVAQITDRVRQLQVTVAVSRGS